MNPINKQKRSSFRIDDILSIKTKQDECVEPEIENADDNTDHVIYSDDEDSDIDVGNDVMSDDVLDVEMSPVEECSSHQLRVKSPAEDRELDLSTKKKALHQDERQHCHTTNSDIHDNNNKSYCDTLKGLRKLSSADLLGSSANPFSSRLVEQSQKSNQDNTKGKTFPLIPKATKIPSSLESLMKTQNNNNNNRYATDYFLQSFQGLSQKLANWSALYRNEMLFPNLTGLSSQHYPLSSPTSPTSPTGSTSSMGSSALSPGGRFDKRCICGSPSCMERTSDLLAGHIDGKYNDNVNSCIYLCANTLLHLL